jgi:hypothetical protein
MFAGYVHYCVGVHISTLEGYVRNYIAKPFIKYVLGKSSESKMTLKPATEPKDEEKEFLLS